MLNTCNKFEIGNNIAAPIPEPAPTFNPNEAPIFDAAPNENSIPVNTPVDPVNTPVAYPNVDPVNTPVATPNIDSTPISTPSPTALVYPTDKPASYPNTGTITL